MRPAVLFCLVVLLNSCNVVEPEPEYCLIGSDTEVQGGVSFLVTSPAQDDTLRVGQPFRFTAEVEATGLVREMSVQLRTGSFLDPQGIVFEAPLEVRTGRYVVDQMIALDTVRAGADLSEVYLWGTGAALINTACGGVYGGGGGSVVHLTLLD